MSSELGHSFHAAGPVELVPSLHDRDKAKYLDQTFTLESSTGDRFRWRCDQRPCKARLITNFYGGDHMVYMFRTHDEDAHRLAVSKQKSPLSAIYMQPVGDHRYMFEKWIGPLQFWRCEHVSFPGRCRTCDGLLVSGPSEHKCSSLTEKPLPDKDEQSNNAPGVVACVGEDAPGIRAVTGNSSRDLAAREQQEKRRDEPQQKRLKREEEKWCPILHKQQPQSRSPATNRRRVEMVEKFSTTFKYTSLVTSKPRSDEGEVIFNAYTRESIECRDNKKSTNKADEETVNARRVQKDDARTRFFVNKAHGKCPGNVSGSLARVKHTMARTGRREHSVVQWLQAPFPAAVVAKRSYIREDVLRQMHRLLEADIELVREMQGTEITLRALLFRRIGTVPTTPAVPTVLTLPAI
ncbi:hypothetical protein HPB51_018758 [Rhipicephalus microplus]|uniref:FLYWCH-type domain-containing protein n=1 Tax=Rhipicephalus microplus TaxID=6941 RepID=A0A9J6DI72_RHIMP|nr:hypothetical protein HPB51_018758 [Rhipicephalus microplus]